MIRVISLKICVIFFLISVITGEICVISDGICGKEEVIDMLDKISWIGHASFKIKGKKVIYIDPWKLKDGSEKADIVLITHSHNDHLSKEDVAKIMKKDTVIITTADCAKEFKENVKTIKPGESVNIDKVEIKGVPAYNINKKFHEKSKNWLGFVIDMEGVKIYHAGDTDNIPEMKEIEADIALLPIGGTYTMNAKEAANAANNMKVKVVIPMHFGDIVGSDKDLDEFKKNCKVEVKVLKIKD